MCWCWLNLGVCKKFEVIEVKKKECDSNNNSYKNLEKMTWPKCRTNWMWTSRYECINFQLLSYFGCIPETKKKTPDSNGIFSCVFSCTNGLDKNAIHKETMSVLSHTCKINREKKWNISIHVCDYFFLIIKVNWILIKLFCF